MLSVFAARHVCSSTRTSIFVSKNVLGTFEEGTCRAGLCSSVSCLRKRSHARQENARRGTRQNEDAEDQERNISASQKSEWKVLYSLQLPNCHQVETITAPLKHELVLSSCPCPPFQSSHGASAGITLSSKNVLGPHPSLLVNLRPAILRLPAGSLRLVCRPTEPQRIRTSTCASVGSTSRYFVALFVGIRVFRRYSGHPSHLYSLLLYCIRSSSMHA